MLVSVIVPARNAEAFLAEALASVFVNAVVPLEVIVVDDGSIDRTFEVAGNFPAIVLQQPPRGVAAARNTGIARATGDFIAWLDADDRWPPGRLAPALDLFAARPEVDVVYGLVREFDDRGSGGEGARRTQPGRLPGSMVIRGESLRAVGGFDEQLDVAEFMDWLVRAKRLGLREAQLDIVCVERRLHCGNLGLVARDRRSDYLRVVVRSLALDRKRGA